MIVPGFTANFSLTGHELSDGATPKHRIARRTRANINASPPRVVPSQAVGVTGYDACVGCIYLNSNYCACKGIAVVPTDGNAPSADVPSVGCSSCTFGTACRDFWETPGACYLGKQAMSDWYFQV